MTASRRSIVRGLGAIATSSLLAGCSLLEPPPDLRVFVLDRSVPPRLLQEFRKVVQRQSLAEIELFKELPALFERLEALQARSRAGKSVTAPDLATLGDYWLTAAVRRKLLRPFDRERLARWQDWQNLGDRWKVPVLRDERGNWQKDGEVWGVPYRWGALAIAYRTDLDLKNKGKDKGDRPIEDWPDLWDPSLGDRLSLPDSPRLVIGLTLKALGVSANTRDLDRVSELRAKLQQLHRQVKFYSSDTYLQPLVLGDTQVAVGWSTDIFPLLDRYPFLQAALPSSGTCLTEDLWVQPAFAESAGEAVSQGNRPDAQTTWIQFYWQNRIAEQFPLRGRVASPVLFDKAPPQFGDRASEWQRLLYPDKTFLDRCEFLQPLDRAAIAQYHALWRSIRLQTA